MDMGAPLVHWRRFCSIAVAYVGLACLLSMAFRRYMIPLQRSQTSSNCRGRISAPLFVVRPVSSKLSSHISMSSFPKNVGGGRRQWERRDTDSQKEDLIHTQERITWLNRDYFLGWDNHIHNMHYDIEQSFILQTHRCTYKEHMKLIYPEGPTCHQ